MEAAHRSFVAILSVVALACLTVGAHAEEQSGAETIHYGQALFVEIEHYDGGALNVMYDVEVAYGPTVWVYFVPREGYYEYVDKTTDTFTYYIDWSDLGTSHTEMEFKLEEYDTYYLIIENSDPSRQDVTVMYDVIYEHGSGWTVGLVLAILLFPITVVVLVVALYVRGRSERGLPPSTPYEPGRMPEDNDPVPPQEERRRYRDTWDDNYLDHDDGWGRSSWSDRHEGSGSRSSGSNDSPLGSMHKRV